MQAQIQVLSSSDREQVHERTLRILSRTGVRVDTARGRSTLQKAGAQVDGDTHVVRFPPQLVEESIRLTPGDFILGARRSGWDLKMNSGSCTMLPDGEAIEIIDPQTHEVRLCTQQDWLNATRLCDAVDEIGLFWSMMNYGLKAAEPGDTIHYWRQVFANFSKHVQLTIGDEDDAPWFIEVLQVLFGDREQIRSRHPVSLLLCPQSPLIIEGRHTDAWLALSGWDIPTAVMPMPLLASTAPGTLPGAILQGNCDTIAMLCLLQAASPGTPFLYAPVPAMTNPYSGVYSGGAVENGLLGAAVVEMARFYHFPVIASGGGTDHFFPGVQSSYESSLNMLLPLLAWPDILVGPGLVGSSMVFSYEKFMIEVEVFRMCRRLHQGIQADEAHFLEQLIGTVGPGGNFLGERSTVKSLRSGEWHIPRLGVHQSREAWLSKGAKDMREECLEKAAGILAQHQPLPLEDAALEEIKKIHDRAVAHGHHKD